MPTVNSNNKILITGGAGYIGTVLISLLVSKGYRVRIIDSFYWGQEHLRVFKDKVELIKTDIRHLEKKHLKNVGAIIHLAALSNDPMADFNPKANFEINTEATKRLAILAKNCGIAKFTFSSSASIYDRGYLGKNRIKNENYPVKPTKAYSLSKFQAEKELLKLADKDFCPVIFRTGTVYGFSPRMRYDLVVNTMVKDALLKKKLNIFCGGVQYRPLIDVRDVAQAHYLAIKAADEKVNGEIINLAYDNYQILDLAKRIQKIIKRDLRFEIKINIDHTKKKDRSYRIANKKVKKILGWAPKISIDQSVTEMIKKIYQCKYTDFENPRYYNIIWMKEKLVSM